MIPENTHPMYAELPWLGTICNPDLVEELIVVDMSPILRNSLMARKSQLHFVPSMHRFLRPRIFHRTEFDEIFLVCTHGTIVGQVGIYSSPPTPFRTRWERLKEKMKLIFFKHIDETIGQSIKRHKMRPELLGYIVFKWPTSLDPVTKKILYSIRVYRPHIDSGEEWSRAPLPTNRLVFA